MSQEAKVCSSCHAINIATASTKIYFCQVCNMPLCKEEPVESIPPVSPKEVKRLIPEKKEGWLVPAKIHEGTIFAAKRGFRPLDTLDPMGIFEGDFLSPEERHLKYPESYDKNGKLIRTSKLDEKQGPLPPYYAPEVLARHITTAAPATEKEWQSIVKDIVKVTRKEKRAEAKKQKKLEKKKSKQLIRDMIKKIDAAEAEEKKQLIRDSEMIQRKLHSGVDPDAEADAEPDADDARIITELKEMPSGCMYFKAPPNPGKTTLAIQLLKDIEQEVEETYYEVHKTCNHWLS